MDLVIGYLYGDLMNIYGDTGNIICLQQRAQWRGIKVKVKTFTIGNKLKKCEADLFFFGGGQDQAQGVVARDLEKSSKGEIIKAEVERGVPLLAICGGYQLLGDYYQPFDKPKLKGVGLFPVYTVASHDRMIGNIVIRVSSEQLPVGSETDNCLVGFENHSGKTYLKEGGQPLGKALKGFGNNGEDKTEGCVYKNAFGCYMHGSLLPKNPQLVDWLLKTALETKYGKVIRLEPLDDTLEIRAHKAAVQKFG